MDQWGINQQMFSCVIHLIEAYDAGVYIWTLFTMPRKGNLLFQALAQCYGIENGQLVNYDRELFVYTFVNRGLWVYNRW